MTARATGPTAAAATPRRDLLAFDRADRWGLAALLGLVSAGAFVGHVVVPLVGWASGGSLRVPFFSPVVVPALEGTGVGHGEADYDVVIAGPSVGMRLLDLLTGLVWLALVAAGCWLLLRVLTDIGRGDPFRPGNVRRLRAIAGLLVVGWPVAAGLQSVVAVALLADVDLGDLGPRATFTLPLVPMLVGLTVALLAEAFRAGSRLRDDVDGLV